MNQQQQQQQQQQKQQQLHFKYDIPALSMTLFPGLSLSPTCGVADITHNLADKTTETPSIPNG
jgi:transcription initiation factor TFIID subunit TAF12